MVSLIKLFQVRCDLKRAEEAWGRTFTKEEWQGFKQAEKKLIQALKAGEKNANAEGESGARYSIREITDKNGKSFGVGVHLDSTLLENLTDSERLQMVKERIKELGGESFTAYDASGTAVEIKIAEPQAKFRNRNGKRTQVNRDLVTKYIKNETKQEAVVLVDELIETAKQERQKPSAYSHGWLDDNGQNEWDYWTTYIQDKNNTIWEATLNVANTADGEKVLYDIGPIKKVERSVKSDTSLPTDSIAQAEKKGNGKFSLKGTEESRELSRLKKETEALKERV